MTQPRGPHEPQAAAPPKSLAVFISYARDPEDPAHDEAVQRLWAFLRSCGIDARLDLGAAHRRLDWTLWMGQQIREADYVLVIASPAYRERAEGRSGPDQGRGVQWEARLIRDAFYADQRALDRFVPVVLPGRSVADVPDFLAPATSTVYTVSDFTIEGAEPLLRMLTDQPEIIEPPLGVVPVLAPRPLPPSAPAAREQPTSSGGRNVVRGTVSGVVIQGGTFERVTVPGPILSDHVQVGKGRDGRTRRAFEDAFRRAGGADRLGRPTDEVYEEGPGFVQHFTGAGEGDAVICAIAGQAAVVVAGPVWDDLVGLPGFPAQGLPAASTDASASRVNLAGGAWGPGVLLRAADSQPARWEPELRLSMEAREAFRLSSAGPADVTVRAIATLPWQLDDLVITRQIRRRIEAALPSTGLSTLIRNLNSRQEAEVQWGRASGPNVHQSGLHAWYEQPFPSPGSGGMVVRAVVRVMLPSTPSSAITVSAEVQVNLPTPGLRITASQIVEAWTAAWGAATVDVPGAFVADPASATLLGSPSIELQIKTNDEAATPPRSLFDVARLSVFGESVSWLFSQGAATVFAPIGLARDSRRAWAARALTSMALGWGFLDADVADLDQTGH